MFDSRKIRALLAACGVFAGGVSVPVAVLADGKDATGLVKVQAEQAVFDDATIEAFAAAQIRIEEIRSAYLPAFEAAQSDAERQQINQQATQEMVAAVEAIPDLTVDQYNAVTAAAAQDPDLAERINEAVATSEM